MTTSTDQATLTAPDISCGHCVATVQTALGALEGVRRAEANAATKQVLVEFDPDRVSEARIREVLDEAGYPARR